LLQSDAIVRAWYEKREGHTDQSRRRAVVAVMRKLVRATFHVAKGEVFDASKLFAVERLDLGSTKARATKRHAETSATNTTAMSTMVAETVLAAPTETVLAAPTETVLVAAAETNLVVAAETVHAAPTETARTARPRTWSKAKAVPVPEPSAG